MFKVFVAMKKRKGMTREEFMRYYKEKHIPFLGTIADPNGPRPKMYARNFVNYGDATFFSAIGEGRAVASEDRSDFDVLTEIEYATREEAMEGMGNIFKSNNLAKLLNDERNLFDLESIKVYAVDVDE